MNSTIVQSEWHANPCQTAAALRQYFQYLKIIKESLATDKHKRKKDKDAAIRASRGGTGDACSLCNKTYKSPLTHGGILALIAKGPQVDTIGHWVSKQLKNRLDDESIADKRLAFNR